MTSAPSARTTALIAPAALRRRPRRAALLGNPNVGKSSLFNALTGLHQKVSNYPGTTVERLVGGFTAQGTHVELHDLPGAYSLLPRSPDEEVVRDHLLGREGDDAPEAIVVVLDATNLERSLFLASQALELGRPVVAALNQCDLAVHSGLRIDAAELERRLGVRVVPTCGRTGQGVAALADAVVGASGAPRPLPLGFSEPVLAEAAALAPTLAGLPGIRDASPESVARLLASEADSTDVLHVLATAGHRDAADAVRQARARLAARGVDVETGTATARYAAIDTLLAGVVATGAPRGSWQARADRVLLHPFAGAAILVVVAAAVLVAIISGAAPLMDAVGDWIGDLGKLADGAVSGGLLGDFLSAGVVAGLGNFLVFVPQIALFFLLLEVLDDTGYLARAAFLLDRGMGRFGLPGRAFLPLLSGFACAIPGILATRTMGNFRDRMVTMAVMPLMSCTARMPVYLLVIAVAFSGMGAFWVGPAVILSMYALGLVVALAASGVLRRTVLKGGRTPLLLDLPPYRLPGPRNVLRNVGRRTWAFVSGAGPTIFVLSLALWTLLTFPRDVALSRDYGAEIARRTAAVETLPAAEREAAREEIQALRNAESAERREQSYLGRAGKTIEPALRPLGFDWKVGVGILGSFAAREVFVATLGVIYAVGEADEEDVGLQEQLRAERWPDGRPVHTPLSGLSLCVFYILAMQCMSTLAVLRRESGGWRWPAAIFVSMSVLAYTASLAVYQAGLALGF